MTQSNQRGRHGIPRDSYCLQYAQGRLICLLWAALFLIIAIVMGSGFIYELSADRSGWGLEDYGFIAFCGILSLGCGMLCAAFAYVGIRDCFFPEKSSLAKSIREQLPHPDEAPPVQELFAMVDRDIRENSIWFDKVAVGKEWVLGSDQALGATASYIPRIRVFCGRDHVSYSRSHGSSRTIEVHILDDRHHSRTVSLKNPRELEQLLNCLQLRAPDALQVSYSEYSRYLTMSQDQWQNLEREYQNRRAQREFREAQAGCREAQDMILTLPDGSVTSRVTEELIRQTLAQALQQGKSFFTLTPGRPVAANGRYYSRMQCVTTDILDDYPDTASLPHENDVYLMLALTPSQTGQSPQEGLMLQCDSIQAETILLNWTRGQVPNVMSWQHTYIRSPQGSAQAANSSPAKLVLISSHGIRQSHQRFTREDVQVGADGIVDGKYQMIDLILPGGYLWMRVWVEDQSKDHCTLTATLANQSILRYYTTDSTRRKAAELLMDYYDGSFRPYGSEWRDCTAEMTKKQGE